MDKTYKLSPSDFAYLYEECKYCYVQKIKNGIYQPSMPMPGIFGAINSRVQGSLVGKNLNEIFPDLPEGKIISQEGFVDSAVVPGTSVFIKGKYDLLMANPDDTYTVIDLKLSQPGEDKIEKYMTQLASYKFAFENPKFMEKKKITGLSLLIFYPDKVDYKNGITTLDFPHTWLNVPIDDGKFLDFMKEVDQLLKGPEPTVSETCKWCLYRKNKPAEKVIQDDLPF
jgi:hypothetical protein